MNKSLLAFVWIAGPLSGTLVQPYVGIRSDNCRISWGKRKPFMLAGGAATLLSLLALAWAREIVRGTLGLFGADPLSRGVQVVTLVFAISAVYILDFAINTGKPGLRSLYTVTMTESKYSAGRYSSFHCGQCTNASARRCQCLGWPTHRRR